MSGEPGPLLDLIERNLALFDVPWTLTGTKQVRLDVSVIPAAAAPAVGDFLECAQMLVDSSADGLRATTTHGAELLGDFGDGSESWRMSAPQALVDYRWWPEIEDLISLIFTTGWRRAGWVPLHAAGLMNESRGVLVCATGGGGKTTFALALVRRGWRLLGDDKVLAGDFDGGLMLAAVKHVLNVDPAIVRWFREVGDLTGLPEYSSWSPKRRVPMTTLWPSAPALWARPTHLLVVARQPGSGGLRVTPLTQADTLAALLRQTVFPRDRNVSLPIATTLTRVAAEVRGYRVEIHEDCYEDDSHIEAVEAVLA